MLKMVETFPLGVLVAIAGAVGIVALILSEVLANRRRFRLFFVGMLGLMAAAGVVASTGSDLVGTWRQDHVRAWNLFHYYLGSKYFPEVGYFDLYPAVFRADTEWANTLSAPTPARRQKVWKEKGMGAVSRARDMHTYVVAPRETLEASFPADRMSEERLRSLGEDVRFLRPYFSAKQWQEVMQDLGYNPAPAWTLLGSTVANLVPAKWPYFSLITLSEIPLALLSMFLLYRAFGMRLTAVAVLWLCLAPFNRGFLLGGFARYDWLACTFISLALYRLGHYRGAGVALSWAAMTRVFPGFVVLPFLLKAALAFLRPLPPETESASLVSSLRHRAARIALPHRRFLSTLTLACSILFLLSHFTGRGVNTWLEWYEKMSLHSELHPVTSNKRIGVGRLALHQIGQHTLWGEIPGSRYERLEASYPRRHALQIIGLLLLLPALVRRRDEDAFILALFSVFLLSTLSRYYASIFALFFFFGAPPLKEHIPKAASVGNAATTFMGERLLNGGLESLLGLIAGSWLLLTFVAWDMVKGDTGAYFLFNYELYGLLAALCIAVLSFDLRSWRRSRIAQRVAI